MNARYAAFSPLCVNDHTAGRHACLAGVRPDRHAQTDMRKGIDGLAMLAQQVLKENPFEGALFAFRGRRGGMVKLLWYDGQGMCLFSKRLERGHFVWPVTETGRVSLTPAQLSMLLEGIDWRVPQRVRQPELAG